MTHINSSNYESDSPIYNPLAKNPNSIPAAPVRQPITELAEKVHTAQGLSLQEASTANSNKAIDIRSVPREKFSPAPRPSFFDQFLYSVFDSFLKFKNKIKLAFHTTSQSLRDFIQRTSQNSGHASNLSPLGPDINSAPISKGPTIVSFIKNTQQLYTEVVGQDLKEEGKFNQQLTRDILGMFNISKGLDGQAEKQCIYIAGEKHTFNLLPQALQNPPSWQSLVPKTLKALLPHEEDQKMAMTLLTQGSAFDALEAAMTFGGESFQHINSGREFHFHKKDQQVFLSLETRFKAIDPLASPHMPEIYVNMEVNLTDKTQPVKVSTHG